MKHKIVFDIASYRNCFKKKKKKITAMPRNVAPLNKSIDVK